VARDSPAEDHDRFERDPQPKNPLHGVTLAMILERLVERMGWEEMGRAVPIRCFTHDPSIKSSLQFLRRTPWARAEVEALYLRGLPRQSPGA
jgi:uncharacterized protein (DUF2132 family)